MSGRTTEQLLHELSQNLPPVRPIPRIRSVLAVVLAAWLGAIALDWRYGLLREGAFGALAGADARFVATLAKLALVAVGAMLASLTSAVPGRESDTRLCTAAAFTGVGLAAGGGLWAVVAAAGSESDTAAGAFLCLSHATALGFLPVLMAALFLARGVAHRPRIGAGLAACGAVALGALVIHASCRAGGALHMLLGHALAPLFLGFALAIPLAALIRHWGRAN